MLIIIVNECSRKMMCLRYITIDQDSGCIHRIRNMRSIIEFFNSAPLNNYNNDSFFVCKHKCLYLLSITSPQSNRDLVPPIYS